MAEELLSEFYEGMRAALGDEGESGSYDYLNEQLDAALRTVVKAGMVPCVGISADKTKLDPAPPNADTWGFIMFKACLILRGGAVARSVRTRAFSESVQPMANRDTVHHLEGVIADIEAKGNLCGAAGDTSDKGLFVAHQDVVTMVRSWLSSCDEPDPNDLPFCE